MQAGRGPDAFRRTALGNPANREILRRLPALGVAQATLTAGCLFQTVWNHVGGRPPVESIRDYDVFYFDDADLSWEAEDAVIRRAAALFADLGVKVEVRNQARVHLWFKRRFGGDYPPLRSAREGIDRYLIACTCVGIEADGALYAPNGVDEAWAGVLRINPACPSPALFAKKAADYRARWPWLRIVPVCLIGPDKEVRPTNPCQAPS